MKCPRLRKEPILFVILAVVLVPLFVITSLLCTEPSYPSMPLHVSDAFILPKVKLGINQSINLSTNPPSTLRMSESRSTNSGSPIIEECHSVHTQLNSCHTLPNFFLYETARPLYENSIINFWHVEKTGGTTMENCLSGIYKEKKLRTIHGSKSCSNLIDILYDKDYFTDYTFRPVVRGHNTLAWCNVLYEQVTDRKCSVFAVFREPYDRMVSFYFFSRQIAGERQDQKKAIPKSLRLPILEWVKQTGSLIQRAFVLKWQISENKDGNKTCHRIQDGELSQKLSENKKFMEDVLNNLDKYFAVVGLYEELPTTLKMLQRVYDIPFYDKCSALHVLQGAYDGLSGLTRDEMKSRAKKELIESDEIRELLKFELKLYAKAKELFEAQKLEFFRMETNGKFNINGA